MPTEKPAKNSSVKSEPGARVSPGAGASESRHIRALVDCTAGNGSFERWYLRELAPPEVGISERWLTVRRAMVPLSAGTSESWRLRKSASLSATPPSLTPVTGGFRVRWDLRARPLRKSASLSATPPSETQVNGGFRVRWDRGPCREACGTARWGKTAPNVPNSRTVGAF